MLKYARWRVGDLSLEADSKVVSIIPVLVRASDDDERSTELPTPTRLCQSVCRGRGPFAEVLGSSDSRSRQSGFSGGPLQPRLRSRNETFTPSSHELTAWQSSQTHKS